MAVFKVNIAGRKAPLFAKVQGKRELVDALITAEQLSADEVETAFADGVKVWKIGEDFPADEAPEETGAGDDDTSTSKKIDD